MKKARNKSGGKSSHFHHGHDVSGTPGEGDHPHEGKFGEPIKSNMQIDAELEQYKSYVEKDEMKQFHDMDTKYADL